MVLSDATGGVRPGYHGDEEERMGSSSPAIRQAALINVGSRRGESLLLYVCAYKSPVTTRSLKDCRIK